MDTKTEHGKSVFAVNSTASLDFQSGSIEENVSTEPAKPKKKPLFEKSPFSLNVTQASTEALRILESQGFGSAMKAAVDAVEAEELAPQAPAPERAQAVEMQNTAPIITPRIATKSAPPLELPVVTEYMDYRRLLENFYLFRREQTKKNLRPYSYSTFAAAANIKSPNYLKMIIEGKRNLSPDMIGRFSKAMNLTKDHSDQFRMLVLFNQSMEPSERNLLLKGLSDLRLRQQVKSGEIDKKTAARLPSWVAWVLYALLDQEGVNFKVESLREVLRGKAKADEIDAALQSLIASGEIAVDEKTGRFVKSLKRMETPEDIPVALIRKLQAQLMLLGLESLYQDSPTEREFGTLTVALTQNEFEELRFKLRQMRKQVHKDISINRMSSPGERVYQMNLQLFPVTDKAKI